MKKSKLLDNGWKTLIESTESIVEIVAQKLIEKIKSSEPTFKIDANDLKTFTKGKIEELFELTDIEEEKADENGSGQPETEFAEVEDLIFKRHQKNKIREKISVTFPDKTVVKGRRVVDTFVESIKKIGPEAILPLNLYRSGVAIVSETKDVFYNQHKIGKYWIMVHTSTREKIAVLNEINDKLNLMLTIEIFTNER